MPSPAVFTLFVATCGACALAQSGPTMRLAAPAVLGQTASFTMRHPASAGQLYVMLAASPVFPGAVGVSIPGLTVNGSMRVDPATALFAAVGLLDASGQSPALAMPVPAVPQLVGFGFDVQGLTWAGNVITFAQDDLEIVVAAPPPAGLHMVAIPPGSFAMGSATVGGTAAPVHTVTITRPFWVGRYEVTQAQYLAAVFASPSFFQGPDLPVESITWFQAVQFCDALSASEAAAGRLPSGYVYRLPTEAEWEYCCQAGAATEWNVGSALACTDANFHAASGYCEPGSIYGGQTATVGSRVANAWGLHDLHGNVAEWCLDSWNLTANYPAGPVEDPHVDVGTYRVVRGGGWDATAATCRSAARDYLSPFYHAFTFGCRVVCAPELP